MSGFRPGARVRLKARPGVPRALWFAEGWIVCRYPPNTKGFDWVVRLDDHGGAIAAQEVLLLMNDTPLMGTWTVVKRYWQPPGLRA